MRKRDTQRSRTGKFDQLVFKLLGVGSRKELELSFERLSFEGMTEFVHSAIARYGNDTYALTIKDGRGRGTAKSSGDQLTVPRWARTRITLCRLVAHVLIERHFLFDGVAWNGPEFVRVYCDLLVLFTPATASDLRRLRKEARVKIAPRSVVPAPPPARTIARLHQARKELAALKSELHDLRGAVAWKNRVPLDAVATGGE